MLNLFIFIAGALIGGISARRRGGNTKDILQYGAVYCMVFGLIGLIATMVALRMGWL